ncbi:MAG: methionyl-tRNA formyltransferase [Planctomycetota bacterium]|jgi:methionyl-tRNA formyltransferase
MRIVYLGSGEFGIECLNALEQSSYGLQFIVTQPPHPAGRGRKPSPTPVARWANAHSIPFIETDSVNTSEVIEKIAGYEPDLIVVIAFGQKIGNELINLPPKGAINVHASLLPKYRGAAPINWAIISGETKTGISIITLAEKMDAGQILSQSQTEIEADETAGLLHDRLAKIAASLLLRTIEQIADGSIVYTEQNHSRATLAPKLKKSDGFLDFAEPAEVLARKIRGFWPWPGASVSYLSKRTGKSMRVTIAMAEAVRADREPSLLPPGTLDEKLNVICGTNALMIMKIKPAGSPLMDFKDFINGRQTQPGDLFGKIDK